MATQRRPGVRVAGSMTRLKDTTIKGQPDGWQVEAYNVVEQVPMIGYLVNLKANTGGMGLLQGQEWSLDEASGTWDWRPTENADVLAQVAELRCEIGGQAEMLRRMILHVETAGRFYLCSIDEVDWEGEATGARFWEPFSVVELTIEPDRRVNPRAASTGAGQGRARWGATSRTTVAQPTLNPETAIVLDCLRVSARRSDEADSPVKRLLPAARQLIWLNMAISAVARQRANGGAVYWPEEITDVDQDATVERDMDALDALSDDMGADASDGATTDTRLTDAEMRKVWTHMTTAIDDPESPSSITPLMVIGPAEFADKIVRLDLAGSFDKLAELRAEVREEIAGGYDAPKEKATGMGGVGGWGAYSVDQDWNRRHVLPLCNFLAEWLTAKLLRPALVSDHGWDWEAAYKFRLVYDGSPIEARTDMATNAKVAREANAISDEAFRRSLGYTESDAPNADDRLRMLAEAMILRAPVATAPALAGFLGFPPEVANVFLAIAAAQAAGGSGGGGAATPGAPTPDAPGPDLPEKAPGAPPAPAGPEQGGPPDTTGAPSADSAAAAILVGVSYQVGRRCAEVIGHRVRSRLDKLRDAEQREALRVRINGSPAENIYAKLTDRERTALGIGSLAHEVNDVLAGVHEPTATATALGVDAALYMDVTRAVAASLLQGLDLEPRRALAAVAAQAGLAL